VVASVSIHDTAAVFPYEDNFGRGVPERVAEDDCRIRAAARPLTRLWAGAYTGRFAAGSCSMVITGKLAHTWIAGMPASSQRAFPCDQAQQTLPEVP
jgi:hypothetical protein